MDKLTVSMRTSLGSAIILMGLLGLSLALMTGETYRHLAIENQRSALVSLMSIESQNLLQDIRDKSKKYAQSLIQQPRFRQALQHHDVVALRDILDDHLSHQFGAESDKLEKLYLFDKDFSPVIEIGDTSYPLPSPICPDLTIPARVDDDPRASAGALCVVEGNRTLYTVVVPLGDPDAIAYLQIAANPIRSLMHIESALGMPIRLTNSNNNVAYQSADWPAANSDGILVSEYTLATPKGRDVLHIQLANDIRALDRKLTRTRYLVMIVASAVTWLVVFVVLWSIDRKTLLPLRRLAKQLRLVRKDKTHLGEQVQVEGNSEVKELANDFNTMTRELKELWGDLEKMAFTDPLTALPNRSRLHELLDYHTRLTHRLGKPFALLMMDLDRFKEVNDTLGHQTGDMLLQQVSWRLEKVLRKTDVLTRVEKNDADLINSQTVARLGGDEFAAILPPVANREDASVVANKILNELERPFMVGGHNLNVGVSIGIALCPADSADSYNLMRLADVAMYQAKTNRKGYCFYDKKFDHHSEQLLTLEEELRHGIDANQLLLHFQPQIDFKTKQVCGAEALLRWQHPTRGLLPPAMFLPVAEQGGLINPLTRWVLNEALAECAKWQERGYPLPVSINLSVLNVFDDEFVNVVADALRQYPIPPKLLSLELSEKAVVTDPVRTGEFLSVFHDMGVGLAIDDFGTSYASISCIKRLPLDTLKIDNSLVMNMRNDGNDEIMVRCAIDLAHNMQLNVVAEGIEDEDTWQAFARLGCDMAQGFHMARPMPADEFVAWLERNSGSASA